jgi:hypothetical protein
MRQGRRSVLAIQVIVHLCRSGSRGNNNFRNPHFEVGIAKPTPGLKCWLPDFGPVVASLDVSITVGRYPGRIETGGSQRSFPRRGRSLLPQGSGPARKTWQKVFVSLVRLSTSQDRLHRQYPHEAQVAVSCQLLTCATSRLPLPHTCRMDNRPIERRDYKLQQIRVRTAAEHAACDLGWSRVRVVTLKACVNGVETTCAIPQTFDVCYCVNMLLCFMQHILSATVCVSRHQDTRFGSALLLRHTAASSGDRGNLRCITSVHRRSKRKRRTPERLFQHSKAGGAARRANPGQLFTIYQQIGQ